MKYFNYLNKKQQQTLFSHQPECFCKTTPREQLRGSLGGLLYIPGTNQTIAQIILSGKIVGLASAAICLEDSIGDLNRADAIQNVNQQLALLDHALISGSLSHEALPLLFIRVENTAMLERMAEMMIRYSAILTGAILPKVTLDTLEPALTLVNQIHNQSADPFYAMPILESTELMASINRISLLHQLQECTEHFFDRILNIRLGATDLCGLYGIRRRMDTTIYNISVIMSCIADVIQVFGLNDRYTISGPVWEYYHPVSQAVADGQWTEIEGLLHEVCLDQQNGLCGKTCIHPAQLLPVQASHVVPWEMYQDATAILNEDTDHMGVLSSVRKNKMNELKPHTVWAKKVLRQAYFFGVYRPEAGIKDLLQEAGKGVHPA